MGKACAIQPKKPMPFWADMWWSFLCIGAIYCQNLSLRINTVTLYQVGKLLNIPAQCLMQYFTKGKVFSLWVYGSLVILTLGVALSTIAELDLDATIAGVFAALAGVVSVVTEQAEIGRLKAKFEMDAIDFMHSNSIHRIIMAACLVPLVEHKALRDIPQMSLMTGVALFLSCLIATLINITVVSIIGKFGAVTTAVLGHLKTVIIISLGFVLHKPAVNLILAKNLTGITVALFGAVKYGQYTSFPETDWTKCCISDNGNMSSQVKGPNGSGKNGKVIAETDSDLAELEPLAKDEGADVGDEDSRDNEIAPDVLGQALDSAEDDLDEDTMKV